MRFLILLLTAAILLAQPKPITKQGLLEALRIGGLAPAELTAFVKQRGVNFRMTAADEAELRTAGAQPPLLQAVRASYRGANAAKPQPRATKPPASAPAAPSAPADPPAPPPAAAEPAPPPAAAPPPPPEPAPSPAPAPAPKAKQPSRPSVDSLSQVRRIFIEDMPEALDDYIRAEIHKQLAGRLEVVLKPELADAIMTGVGDQKTGTGAAITGRYLGLHDNATGAVSIVDRNKVKILWSEEAGDRSLLLGAFKRGGPRKVAGRLVGKLKKVL